MRYFLLLFVALGCGADDIEVTPSDYDTTCSTDEECIAVRVGKCTDECGFSYGWSAINKSSYDDYEDDVDSLNCGRGTANCMIPVPATGAACHSGICEPLFQ